VIKRSRPFGICCAECSAAIIAPITAEYVNERHVRHSWSCEDCGHQFITFDRLELDRMDSRSKSPSLAA
jgi:transcriptional regulator NrdR family protein